MLSGLEHAPATFQIAMMVVPVPVRWRFKLVYSADIVVISKSPQDHVEQV